MVMRDVQNESDGRNIPIDRVGVSEVSYPITVLDPSSNVQHTVAAVRMAVSLPDDFRGTHMSRFIEVLNEFRGKITLSNMEVMTEHLRKRLNAHKAEISFKFPYFIEKKAPVTGSLSFSRYDVSFWASKGNRFDFILKVGIPVTTLCPCSREISDFGAHNQRARIVIAVRMSRLVWIEDIVKIGESCASSPVYTLLKREDEKFVTERAYENPRFVEDVVRDVAILLEKNERISWYRISVKSHESIHDHEAFAEIESLKSD